MTRLCGRTRLKIDFNGANYGNSAKAGPS
jgi:hypothetical protein